MGVEYEAMSSHLTKGRTNVQNFHHELYIQQFKWLFWASEKGEDWSGIVKRGETQPRKISCRLSGVWVHQIVYFKIYPNPEVVEPKVMGENVKNWEGRKNRSDD